MTTCIRCLFLSWFILNLHNIVAIPPGAQTPPPSHQPKGLFPSNKPPAQPVVMGDRRGGLKPAVNQPPRKRTTKRPVRSFSVSRPSPPPRIKPKPPRPTKQSKPPRTLRSQSPTVPAQRNVPGLHIGSNRASSRLPNYHSKTPSSQFLTSRHANPHTIGYQTKDPTPWFQPKPTVKTRLQGSVPDRIESDSGGLFYSSKLQQNIRLRLDRLHLFNSPQIMDKLTMSKKISRQLQELLGHSVYLVWTACYKEAYCAMKHFARDVSLLQPVVDESEKSLKLLMEKLRKYDPSIFNSLNNSGLFQMWPDCTVKYIWTNLDLLQKCDNLLSLLQLGNYTDVYDDESSNESTNTYIATIDSQSVCPSNSVTYSGDSGSPCLYIPFITGTLDDESTTATWFNSDKICRSRGTHLFDFADFDASTKLSESLEFLEKRYLNDLFSPAWIGARFVSDIITWQTDYPRPFPGKLRNDFPKLAILDKLDILRMESPQDLCAAAVITSRDPLQLGLRFLNCSERLTYICSKRRAKPELVKGRDIHQVLSDLAAIFLEKGRKNKNQKQEILNTYQIRCKGEWSGSLDSNKCFRVVDVPTAIVPRRPNPGVLVGSSLVTPSPAPSTADPLDTMAKECAKVGGTLAEAKCSLLLQDFECDLISKLLLNYKDPTWLWFNNTIHAKTEPYCYAISRSTSSGGKAELRYRSLKCNLVFLKSTLDKILCEKSADPFETTEFLVQPRFISNKPQQNPSSKKSDLIECLPKNTVFDKPVLWLLNGYHIGFDKDWMDSDLSSFRSSAYSNKSRDYFNTMFHDNAVTFILNTTSLQQNQLQYSLSRPELQCQIYNPQNKTWIISEPVYLKTIAKDKTIFFLNVLLSPSYDVIEREADDYFKINYVASTARVVVKDVWKARFDYLLRDIKKSSSLLSEQIEFITPVYFRLTGKNPILILTATAKVVLRKSTSNRKKSLKKLLKKSINHVFKTGSEFYIDGLRKTDFVKAELLVPGTCNKLSYNHSTGGVTKCLWFESTKVNTIGHSRETCRVNGLVKYAATRSCLQTNQGWGRWSDPSIQGDCDLSFSSLSPFYNLSQTCDVSDKALEKTGKILKFRLKYKNVTKQEVKFISDLLYEVSTKDDILDQMAANFVGVVSDVSNVDHDVIAASDSASLIVKSLDRFTDNLAFNGTEWEKSAGALAVKVEQFKLTSDSKYTEKFKISSHRGSNGSLFLSDSDSTDVRLSLPSQPVNRVIEGNTTGRISFVIYNNTNLFQPSSPLPHHQKVHEFVVSASFGESVNLSVPVEIFFNLSRVGNVSNKHCVFWEFDDDNIGGDWSSEGCRLHTSSNDSDAICLCDHLTHFGVILDFYGQDNPLDETQYRVLSIVSIIGLCLSILCLSFTVLTFFIFRRLRSTRTRQVLFNLAVALLCSWVVFLSGIYHTSNRILCISVAVLLHYFILVALAWMLIEGIVQYLDFVKVVGTYIPNFIYKAGLPAWLFPLIPVAAVLGIDYELYYGGENYCWMKTTAFYFAFLIPFCFIFLANLVLFILILRGLYCGRTAVLRSTQSEEQRRKLHLKAGICVCVLIGLTWVFAFFAIGPARFVFQLLFCVFSSLQGVFIFAVMVASENSVRRQWRQICCCQKPEKQSTTGKRSCTSSNQHTSNGQAKRTKKRLTNSTSDKSISTAGTRTPSESSGRSRDLNKNVSRKNRDPDRHADRTDAGHEDIEKRYNDSTFHQTHGNDNFDDAIVRHTDYAEHDSHSHSSHSMPDLVMSSRKATPDRNSQAYVNKSYKNDVDH